MKNITYMLWIPLLVLLFWPVSEKYTFAGTTHRSPTESVNAHQAHSSYPVAQNSAIETNTGNSNKPDINTVSINISYNPDKSKIITQELLNNIRRELLTAFIGYGYRYSAESNSDLRITAFLDFEVSSYEQQNSIIYDVVSSITFKARNNKDSLLKELNKNIFISGNDVNELIHDSARKAASLGGKELIGDLKLLVGKHNSIKANAPSLKIEIIFLGNISYKYYNLVNNLLIKSPYNLELIKRTFDPGQSFSIVIVSWAESDIIANYLQQNTPAYINLELADNQTNRLVFMLSDSI